MTSPDAVTASTEVDAPASTVFDILADPRQHQRIDGSGTLRGDVAGPARLELGSTFGMGMKQGAPYRTTNRVVEFEENRLIAWRHNAPHRWRYELLPLPDGGTKVTETWDVSRWPAVGQAFLRLVRYDRKTQKGIEQTLAKLKAAAEQDVRTPS